MLSLHNFNENITTAMLKRGEQYLLLGTISGIEQAAPEKWELEISGSEVYNVNMCHGPNHEVTN